MDTALQSDAFEVCLQRLDAGERAEQIAASYPQWVEPLTGMLRLAWLTRQVGASILVPKAALVRSRARFLSAALQPPKAALSLKSLAFTMRPGMAFLLVLLVLFVAGFTTLAVSAQALPGDRLYPLKLLSEQTRLLLVRDQAERLKMEQSYDQLRAEEIDHLIQHSRSAPVQFAGGLSQAESGAWMVNNILILINADTQVEGEIFPGLHVRVQGTLLPNGSVLAARVSSQEYRITGIVNAISPERWQVEDVFIAISPDTAIDGPVEVGSRVTVYSYRMASGALQARTVKLLGQQPTLEPTRTPQPPSPTWVEPSRTPLPPPTDAPAQLLPSRTPRPTHSAEPNGDPEPTHDGDDDGEEGGQEDTGTPRPRRTPRPTEDDDHESEATRRPTRTPRPTEDDDHREYTRTPTPYHDD